MKRVVILGSTGSIGTQTLDVVRRMPGRFQVTGLAANRSAEALLRQVREFKPKMAVLFDRQAYLEASKNWPFPETVLGCGMEGLTELASLEEADIVVTAMVGMIGLRPTVAALRAKKTIALANKETLVCAGQYIMSLAEKSGSPILPVDSEHGAVFQCLRGRRPEEVAKLWLTASGGPFRGYTAEELASVTKAQALKHPSWTMGQKITIDSATMVNKGLEIIEARWLFGVSEDRIGVVVHPQSVIHSLVEYTDGSQIAQLAVPDMRLPIEAALLYPECGERVVKPLRLADYGQLTFEAPDEEVFSSLKMAREVLRKGGLYPAVFNAANEAAVQAFLQDKIGFGEIFSTLESALDWAEKKNVPGGAYELEEVFAWEQAVREEFTWA